MYVVVYTYLAVLSACFLSACFFAFRECLRLLGLGLNTLIAVSRRFFFAFRECLRLLVLRLVLITYTYRCSKRVFSKRVHLP